MSDLGRGFNSAFCSFTISFISFPSPPLLSTPPPPLPPGLYHFSLPIIFLNYFLIYLVIKMFIHFKIINSKTEIREREDLKITPCQVVRNYILITYSQ